MFIIPIEKDNPVYATPWIVYFLVVINTLIFIPTKYFLPFEEIARQFGFVPAKHELFSLFSSMFLHGGIMHILGNMIFLWLFGDNVEDVIGPLFFLFTYLLGGLCATFLHYSFNLNSTTPCIGASGAISGIVGIYIVFFPKAKVDLVIYFYRFEVKTIETTALCAIGAWLSEQTILGVFMQSLNLSKYFGVAFWAHVGGLLAGVVMGYILIFAGFREKYYKNLTKQNRRNRHWLLGNVA